MIAAMRPVRELLENTVELWLDADAEFPEHGRRYSSAEQTERESHLDRFLDTVETELRRLPRNRAERDETRAQINAAFTVFGRGAMDLEDRHLDLLLGGGFSAVGTSLGRQARRFDAGVATLDILQACRNAWTACGLQALLGREMCITPSIFAYSMLYPYSDNYMDDAAVGREAKLGFSGRFRARLAGETVAPANGREESIWRLVGMIEGQYKRAEYPQVFDSLLAIHRAQEESLRLGRGGGASVDVLRLGFQKGGTSVLADAYLAGGSITEEAAKFAFEWGVLLQLADDLQDVREDRESAMFTLFSQAASKGTLDELTSRTLNFGQGVMARLAGFDAGAETLKELLINSSRSILIRSAGLSPELYSAAYLARIEACSPFRFGFLRDRREKLARRSGLLMKLFESFLAGEEDEPAFPLLPSTLMPRG